MNQHEMPSNDTTNPSAIACRKNPTTQKAKRASFQKVLNGRGEIIRGLCVRDGQFYARLDVGSVAGGKKNVIRTRLVGVTTPAAAKQELDKLKTQRAQNALPSLKRTPKLRDYVEDYFRYLDTVPDKKRPATIQKEKGSLKLWIQNLGEKRLNMITKAQINAFIAKRQGEGKSARTVNLDVIMLRNVLNKALEDDLIGTLPMQGLRALKESQRKRALVDLIDIEKVCASAVEVSKNGQEFSDYVKLMAFCGSRRDETLRLKWEDVDWSNGQITIGSDGQAKNRKSRAVDFNSKLESHLRDMLKRRDPESTWIFPSPQRGDNDTHAKSFKETLTLAKNNLAAKEGKTPGFTFHDCRHFFISFCVMSGIQTMTIADWVSHQDGGVLIGKTYGHLSNAYKKMEAQKVNFQPCLISSAVSA